MKDYANVYCSISGTACCLAQCFAYVGTGRNGYRNIKDYIYGNELSEQQFIYDVFYAYGRGTQNNYYHAESRISSAYKLYAFQAFRNKNNRGWNEWSVANIVEYCANVTEFTWKFNTDKNFPNLKSNIRIPEHT